MAAVSIVFLLTALPVLTSVLGNREDPVGYKIISVPFSTSSHEPEADKDSTSAAKDILTNKDLSRCPSDCFRPVGMAWDRDNRLYFSSDSTGEIFVLRKDGASNNDNGDGNGSSDNGDGNGSDQGGDDEDGVPGLHQFAPRSAVWAVTFAAVVVGMLLT